MSEPRYIAWVDTRQFYMCSTLVEAFDWRKEAGATVYEPLGLTTAERVCADDAPVTADWLLSLGGKKDGQYVGIPCEGMDLWFYVDAGGSIHPKIEWDGGYLPGEYRTRGQVVRLLAAFGIPLPT